MQDAIEKVRQISLAKTSTGATRKPEQTNERRQHNKNDPEELKESIWRRTMSNEEGERLYELTELGLSVDAARELREQEKAIAEVHKMLEEKKKKIITTKPSTTKMTKARVETGSRTTYNKC